MEISTNSGIGLDPIRCRPAPPLEGGRDTTRMPPPPDATRDTPLDFTTIDSPLKAALHPAQNPFVVWGLSIAVVGAIIGELFGGSVEVGVQVLNALPGGQTTDIAYRYRTADKDEAVKGNGNLGAAVVVETITGSKDEKRKATTITYAGKTGASDVALRFELTQESVNDKSAVARVKGKMGTVGAEMDLRYSISKEGDGSFELAEMSGTFDGVPYHLTGSYTFPDKKTTGKVFQAKLRKEEPLPEMSVAFTGTLGDRTITRSYKLSAVDGNAHSITFAGESNVAGVRVAGERVILTLEV